MNLSESTLKLSLVVLIAIAHAQKYPTCPDTESCGGTGLTMTEYECNRLSLPPQDKCGWVSSSGTESCGKTCFKSYHLCMSCQRIFAINKSFKDMNKQPCNHSVKDFVKPPSGPSPGPSEPDTRKPFLHSFFPTKPE
ncbi:hypothetical protein PGT21_009839 [Puccinia graminis f. sp. tritici]|uniref:Secreted protein n=1 Tax=Puccinia graminis f. sp. tritici TaxID=56615 RepID=A0A5B0Q2J9_PUCGR|nr:hypothetical protein PGT21_009839 [Puccinia graminis f. sp. tritici]KAA1124892.1 hypothetical protein PGTUg99_036448 [Puccinia graminis f. sp. tritici]